MRTVTGKPTPSSNIFTHTLMLSRSISAVKSLNEPEQEWQESNTKEIIKYSGVVGKQVLSISVI